MARKTPRRLSSEEQELWNRVARQIKPLDPRPTEAERDPIAEALTPKTTDHPASATLPLPDLSIGSRADHRRDNDLVHGLPDRLGPRVMDKRLHTRMKRGRLTPDAKIDLHGMTLAQAHPALMRFILGAHADGMRLVLIITGKGKDRDETSPIPTPRGVLRHHVPQWLRLPPLAPLVMQISEAHFRHGGGGAYYVYLRRAR
jgi:DNA-nicking Smr family endonuclease